jgi:hypothetical protein
MRVDSGVSTMLINSNDAPINKIYKAGINKFRATYAETLPHELCIPIDIVNSGRC